MNEQPDRKNEEPLRALFSELASDEAQRAPEFAALCRAPGERRVTVFGHGLVSHWRAGLALAAGLLLVGMLVPHWTRGGMETARSNAAPNGNPSGASAELSDPLDSIAMYADWESPTAFLLDVSFLEAAATAPAGHNTTSPEPRNF